MKFHLKIKYLLIIIGILLLVILTISTNILNKNSLDNSSSKQSKSKIHRPTDQLLGESVNSIILIPEKSYNRSFAGNDIEFRIFSVDTAVQVKMLDSNGNFEKNMSTFKKNIKKFEKNFTLLFLNWVTLFENSNEIYFRTYDYIFQPFNLLVSNHNIVLNRNTVFGINTIKASKDFLNLCSLLFLFKNKQIDKEVINFWLKIFEITKV